MSKTGQHILKQWMSEGTFTVHDLADAGGCSTDSIYKYAAGRSLPYDVARRIHRNLAGPNGHGDLLENMLLPTQELCPRGAASADGVIDDEMTDMLEALGKVVTQHRAGDRYGMTDAIQKAGLILARAKAERDRL